MHFFTLCKALLLTLKSTIQIHFSFLKVTLKGTIMSQVLIQPMSSVSTFLVSTLSLEKIYMNSDRLRSHKSDMDNCSSWVIRNKNVLYNVFFHITSLDYMPINYLAFVFELIKVISTNSLLLSCCTLDTISFSVQPSACPEAVQHSVLKYN